LWFGPGLSVGFGVEVTSDAGDYPQLDVIVVGAHPDDAEIACGGTLARLANLGYKVGIIDLTDGEPTPGSPGPEVRLEEARKAADVLGVKARVTLDLPNRRLFDSFETRQILATEFRKYRPKVVIGHGGRTPMASPDHWQAMQITDAAVFYSRLSKWDEHFDGLPSHRVLAQLYFTLTADPTLSLTGPTQFVADISDTLDAKLAAVRCYESQFPPERQHVLRRIQGAALQCGSAAGYTAGEMFVTARVLGTPDIIRMLLSP